MSQAIALHAAHEILRSHACGTVSHRYEGLCPDCVEGQYSRDPDCNVCHAIDETQRLLKIAEQLIRVTEYDPESLAGKIAAEFLTSVKK